jgi:hypothetical protein
MKSTEQLFRTMVALMSDEEILRMRKRITLKMNDDADGSSLYEALSDELLGRDAIAELNAERQVNRTLQMESWQETYPHRSGT